MYAIFSYLGGVFLGGQLIPQIYRTYKQKNADNLSLIFLCCNITGLLFMAMYGIFNNDYPLVIPIAFSLCNTFVLLFLKIFFHLRNNDLYINNGDAS
jgi:uncharacterized protein with PQ loop repeat